MLTLKILFIHQNFPAQFKTLAPQLVTLGHHVTVLTLRNDLGNMWQGVQVVPYHINRGSSASIHPWVADFETKVIRGEACFSAALCLKNKGYSPDVIIAHHGWGESLFLREVWPLARMGIYCEFFYDGSDMNFDEEFLEKTPNESLCKTRLKNINNYLHFHCAHAGISPTAWQAQTFPDIFRTKITVVHDGIDTRVLVPNTQTGLRITKPGSDSLTLSHTDEVITFVNRNLEPYRGFHSFMRALPELLFRRPTAQILIVGATGKGYGALAPAGTSWKQVYLDEIRGGLSQQAYDRIHFLGTIPYSTYISILQISTVHVYLTYPFVLGWSLLEAMSVGCAVVASKTGPVVEVIEDGVQGCLVDFFDIKGITDQICTLLEDSEQREFLGRNARALVQQRYDLHSVCLPAQIDWVMKLSD